MINEQSTHHTLEQILNGEVEITLDQLHALIKIVITLPEFKLGTEFTGFDQALEEISNGTSETTEVAGWFKIQAGMNYLEEPEDEGVIYLIISIKSGTVLKAASYKVTIALESEGFANSDDEKQRAIFQKRLKNFKKDFIFRLNEKINLPK